MKRTNNKFLGVMMQLQQQQVAHNRFRSTWLHAAAYTEGK